MEGITKEIAQKFLEMLTGTQRFILEQAPDVVQQLVAVQRVSYTFWTCISLLMLGGCVWSVRAIRAFYLAQAAAEAQADDWTGFVIIGGGIATAVTASVGLLVLCACTEQALVWWIAPKVALLQELTHIISGGTK